MKTAARNIVEQLISAASKKRRLTEALSSVYVETDGLVDSEGNPCNCYSATDDSILSAFSEYGPFTQVQRHDPGGFGRYLTCVGKGGKKYQVQFSEVYADDGDEVLENELEIFED